MYACPVLILYPSFLYATFGRRVNFTGKVEAKLEYPIEGLWQRLQHGVLLKSINQDEKKYLDTNALAPSQLVINNVNFDDEGEYRLQVRISTGWCSSNTVRLQHVYGKKLHLKWTVPINNTRVDSYYITISDQHSTIITSYPSSNDLEVSTRLQPGTNYTVTLYAKSYGSYSPQYTEEIQTLRTPLLTINPSGWPDIPYLSNLEIQCIIRNISDFPPTLETKWQRNKLDVNISDAMYNGSSLDLINPKLVINRIDFDRDDDVRYQCMAQNSEGWGSSLSDIRIDVKGRNYLQAQSVGIQSTTCDISITWNHPYQHADLVTGYEVYLQEKTENSWKSSEKIYAGNSTSYTSPCTLQSGRLYRISIRSLVLLSNPMQTITVETSFYKTILEPRKPGAIVTNLSNFSADGVHLVWEESDGFVNRYIVRIDDHEQETLDKKPTIDWDQLLLPDTLYNVTITAISYGFTTNDYHFYGRRLSLPAASFILTTKSQYTGKAFLSYGDGDYKLTGDDVTSPALRSPTTVYIGDGTEDGFNYVVIGTNGVIGLGETFNSGSIHAMDSKHVKKRQILCPFWTDLASKDNVGKVYYNTYRRGKDRASVDSAFMEKADGIVKKYFKDLKYFKATWLVKVTWENMTLYGHKEQRDVAFNVRMFMYYKVQQ
uniref:Alpha-tectorin n=1 Tax=Magallana gigas TaxID=29159 RepID=K1QPB6_MAGGI